MLQASKAQFKAALFTNPHSHMITISHPTVHKVMKEGESTLLHPERLLWIDTKKHVAVLSAILLPKFTHIDFKGRMVFGFRLGQTKRHREYIIAPFDESGRLGAITPIHTPVQRIIFGRAGLMHKAFHTGTESHFISHTPSEHDSLADLMGQVGPFTSDKHLEVGLEAGRVEIRSISPYGTLAIAP